MHAVTVLQYFPHALFQNVVFGDWVCYHIMKFTFSGGISLQSWTLGKGENAYCPLSSSYTLLYLPYGSIMVISGTWLTNGIFSRIADSMSVFSSSNWHNDRWRWGMLVTMLSGVLQGSQPNYPVEPSPLTLILLGIIHLIGRVPQFIPNVLYRWVDARKT